MVTVTQPAVVPTSPSSPSTVLDIAIGVLLGLAGGIALALFRHTLDTTVKSPDDVTQRYRIASLGQVPYDRKSKKRPVAEFGGAKESFRTEAFRRVRTNLQFVEIESQPRSILVTSAMADEGKTTTACNIAMGLAQVGVDVILLEGDLRRSKFTKYLGVASPGGLTSVLMGWTSWQDELVSWDVDDARVRVLTAGTHPPNPNELLASEAFVRNLTELEDACDVVIIDGPPLLPVSDSSLIAASASGTVLVIRHGKTRYKAVEAGLEALTAVDAKLYGFVLNMGPYDARETGNYSRYASTVTS
jgi:non-specific protein-tyrosine kinase